MPDGKRHCAIVLTTDFTTFGLPSEIRSAIRALIAQKNLLVCRCLGAPACRVFPDHLIACK